MSRCSSTVLTVQGRVGLVGGGCAPPPPFGVKGVNVAAFERGHCVLDKTRLVERVGVDRNRDVELFGDAETGIDRRRGRSPILVKLQSAGAGLDHFNERARIRSIAFAKKTEI